MHNAFIIIFTEFKWSAAQNRCGLVGICVQQSIDCFPFVIRFCITLAASIWKQAVVASRIRSASFTPGIKPADEPAIPVANADRGAINSRRDWVDQLLCVCGIIVNIRGKNCMCSMRFDAREMRASKWHLFAFDFAAASPTTNSNMFDKL